MPWARMSCPNCGGTGFTNVYGDPDDVRECPQCDGSGGVVARDARGRFLENKDSAPALETFDAERELKLNE